MLAPGNPFVVLINEHKMGINPTDYKAFQTAFLPRTGSEQKGIGERNRALSICRETPLVPVGNQMEQPFPLEKRPSSMLHDEIRGFCQPSNSGQKEYSRPVLFCLRKNRNVLFDRKLSLVFPYIWKAPMLTDLQKSVTMNLMH